MKHRRFYQKMASEWQTAFAVSHKMPWCALLGVKNYNKHLEKLQDFFFKTETKTKMFKTKTKTFIFVLEAPRDQDPGLEDYFIVSHTIELRSNSFPPKEVIRIKCDITLRKISQ